MEEILHRAFVNFGDRVNGPMALRFVLQPIVAAVFAIRAGLRDAHEGNAPYLLRLALSTGGRPALLAEAWADVGKLFVVAMVLDLVYQLAIQRTFYIGETVVIAFVLAIVPYALVRSLTLRIARRALNR